MRYAVISDIHGNREALDTVLEKIELLACDKIACLGDIVGYGADPGYCLERIRDVSDFVVAGNHDYAALGKISIDYFNAHARQATLWTREQLTPDQRRYLESLPLVVVDDKSTFVHGSLDSPQLFDYIQTSYDAFLTMEQMQTRICFIGHSHVPITFLLNDVITYSLDNVLELTAVKKSIVNVGSVGQPRDNNPLAAFAVYDDERDLLELHRVPYDVEKTAARILQAGLPEFLAERLKVGR
ncbi:MAG: metallophosphoesterase [Planctomycetota bacterium]